MRARRGAAACLVVLLVLAGTGSGAGAQSPSPVVPESPFVLVGVGAGALSVDVPHPEKPGETFGTRFRSRFDLGVRPRPWLEVGAELSLARLGASDSVNAILAAQGDVADAAYTLVDWNVSVRYLLPEAMHLVPWVRAGVGQAWLRLSAPEGRRVQDLAWVGGVGLDAEPWRSVLFRAEARYLGIASDPETAHNFGATLGLFYAMRHSQFD